MDTNRNHKTYHLVKIEHDQLFHSNDQSDQTSGDHNKIQRHRDQAKKMHKLE